MLQLLLRHHGRGVRDSSVDVDVLGAEESEVSLALSDAVRHVDRESNELGTVICQTVKHLIGSRLDLRLRN